MTRISSLIWASVTLPGTPSGVTTWKYTGTVALKPFPPLPFALAGTSAATWFSDGSRPSAPRAAEDAEPSIEMLLKS